jgi:NDP-sugar pyrophosphorylase family protein
MPRLESVTAFILVGGFGTRLREVIGEDVPKPLAPIDGQPFLQRLLTWLFTQGIRKVVLGTGHLADTFEVQLQSFAPAGMDIQFSREEKPLGTGGAIKNAIPFLGAGTVLVLNGDSVASVSLRDLVAFHDQNKADATLALVEVPDTSRFGTVHTDAHGLVNEFLEKTGESKPGNINAGMYVISPGFLANLPDEEVFSFERDVLPTHCNQNVYAKTYQGSFIDIGTPESYQEASEFFRKFEQ